MFKSHMPSIYKVPLPQTKGMALSREAQTLAEIRLTFPFVREHHLYAKATDRGCISEDRTLVWRAGSSPWVWPQQHIIRCQSTHL